MGNTRSEFFEPKDTDNIWWQNENENSAVRTMQSDLNGSDEEKTREERRRENAVKLSEFKQDLARKHEKHRQLIKERRKEMQQLHEDLVKQKKENEELKQLLKQKGIDTQSSIETKCIVLENERLKKTCDDLRNDLTKTEAVAQKNNELRLNIVEIQSELQAVNESVEKERQEYHAHVTALKDVIRVTKQMLQIRENQLIELRQKVTDIEASLADRDLNVLSEDLRKEYERQLNNIKNLKALYEERQRADKKAKDELTTQLNDAKKDLQKEQTKNNELQERLEDLEKDNSEKYDKINTLESNLGFAKAECRELQAEMSVINQLFSQILLGFNNCQEVDLDKLIKLLEENHDLLQNIVINEESNEISSALPKVLLDLITQINNGEETTKHEENKLETIMEETGESQASSLHHLNSAEEIVENLPKVWRVLIELLSHQSTPTNPISENEDHCYKQIQTPNGPKLALSVSKTFIRLKDLILEKKTLEKDMNQLKHLNTHLEVRLQDQEKRLETVSTELSKTWHVVGKMQRQHQQLHTQEKILRYELAQKRKMLTELKEELEYCREKWLQAREKNSNTEEQWKQLRTEFASRKIIVSDDLNNSVESGYSDERECSSDEEPGYETDISESTHKISSPENEEILADIVEDDDGRDTTQSEETKSTILEVIKKEIEQIEGDTVESGNCSNVQSTDEVLLHSLEQNKTDLVQNSNLEKTGTSSEVQIENSTTENTPNISRSPEEVLSNREERLRRLEEQTKQLVAKVANTSNKSVAICTKLENLHEMYGENSTQNKQLNSTESETNERTNTSEDITVQSESSETSNCTENSFSND